MMFRLRLRIATWLAEMFTNVVPLKRAELAPEDLAELVRAYRDAEKNAALQEEIDTLIASASKAIIRRVKIDEEAALHRGGIIYLESLRSRIARKAAFSRKKDQ